MRQFLQIFEEAQDRSEYIRGVYRPKYEKLYDYITGYAGFKKSSLSSDHMISKLFEADPTSPGDGKAGKYSEWIVRSFLQLWDVDAWRYEEYPLGTQIAARREHFARRLHQMLFEDMGEVHDNLDVFHRYKHTWLKRDINQVGKGRNPFKELNDIVAETKDRIWAEERDQVGEDEFEKIYDHDRWLVVIPKTEKAACKYGQGTQWCTAGRNNNQFDRYSNSPLFVVILRPMSKDRLKELKGLRPEALKDPQGHDPTLDQIDLAVTYSGGAKWQIHYDLATDEDGDEAHGHGLQFTNEQNTDDVRAWMYLPSQLQEAVLKYGDEKMGHHGQWFANELKHSANTAAVYNWSNEGGSVLE